MATAPRVTVSVVVAVVSATSVAVTVSTMVTVDAVEMMQLQALLMRDEALPHCSRILEDGSAEGSSRLAKMVVVGPTLETRR